MAGRPAVRFPWIPSPDLIAYSEALHVIAEPPIRSRRVRAE